MVLGRGDAESAGAEHEAREHVLEDLELDEEEEAGGGFSIPNLNSDFILIFTVLI